MEQKWLEKTETDMRSLNQRDFFLLEHECAQYHSSLLIRFQSSLYPRENFWPDGGGGA